MSKISLFFPGLQNERQSWVEKGNSIFVFFVIFVAKIASGIQTSLVILVKTDKLMPC